MSRTIKNLFSSIKDYFISPQEKHELVEEAEGLINHSFVDIIYLDLDGVLVNQYSFLASLDGITEKEFLTKLKSFKTEKEKEDYIYPLIIKSVEAKGFILAKPTREIYQFKSLVEYWLNLGIRVEILSSCMQDEGLNTEIIRQKQIWLQNNNLGHLPANFPKGSKYKQLYAKERAVLIDDFDRNIEEWNNVPGSIGIHHTTMSQTITKLKELKLH